VPPCSAVPVRLRPANDRKPSQRHVCHVDAMLRGAASSDQPACCVRVMHGSIDVESRACCREVQLAAVPAFQVVAIMQPLNAIAFVGDGVFQGAKDFNYLAAVMAAACAATIAVMLTGNGSLVHVWVALALLQGGRAVGVIARWTGLHAGFGASPLALVTSASTAGSIVSRLLEESEGHCEVDAEHQLALDQDSDKDVP
jgi:hypothetical protein